MGTKAVDAILDVDTLRNIEHLFPVTPSDTNELPFVTRKLYIAGAGNIKIVARGDSVANAVTIAVSAGQILDVACRQVFATGTTATGIVGGY